MIMNDVSICYTLVNNFTNNHEEFDGFPCAVCLKNATPQTIINHQPRTTVVMIPRESSLEVLQKLKTSATSASSGLDTHMTHIQVDPSCLNFGGWDFAILGCSTHSMTMYDRSGVEPPIPA